MKFCPKCGTSLTVKDNPESHSTTHKEENVSVRLDSKKEVKNDSTVNIEVNATSEKPKISRFKRLSIALVLLLIVLSGVFYYFTQTNIAKEAEEDIFNIEFAAGYWVAAASDDNSINNDKFVSEELTMALYIDSKQVVIERNGEETVELYTISSYTEYPEQFTLEIEIDNNSEEKETLNLVFSLYNDEAQSVTLSISDGQSYTLLKVTEESYTEAGGSSLSLENSNEEVVSEEISGEDSEIDETSDVSLEEVEGYYIKRDENGVISEIYYINDEFISLVMIHP